MFDLFTKYRDILIREFNVTAERFNSEFNNHVERLGYSNQSKRDFIWRCFNEILSLYAKAIPDEEDMYRKQKEINMQMWSFLRDEGRDIKTIRKQVTKLDLLIARARNEKSTFISEIVIIGTKCCTECDKIDGKQMDVQEAIELQILPYSNCIRNGGCVCCYSDVALRNADGRLVQKNNL